MRNVTRRLIRPGTIRTRGVVSEARPVDRVGATLASYVEAKMSTKATIALTAAIVLSSAITAAAQAPRYYNYIPGAARNPGTLPYISDNPAATGGGSAGYNQNLRYDW